MHALGTLTQGRGGLLSPRASKRKKSPFTRQSHSTCYSLNTSSKGPRTCRSASLPPEWQCRYVTSHSCPEMSRGEEHGGHRPGQDLRPRGGNAQPETSVQWGRGPREGGARGRGGAELGEGGEFGPPTAHALCSLGPLNCWANVCQRNRGNKSSHTVCLCLPFN